MPSACAERNRQEKSLPINYRIYDKKEGKTKNDYFKEMLLEVITWGLKPKIVTGDSWYSSVANLKFLRNQKLGFLFGVEKNRTVSNQPGKYQQVSTLTIPDEGLITHLKEFGFIKLLRKDFKKGDSRHYVLYLPDSEKLQSISRQEFITIHDTHWGIEAFHRALKQVGGICRFMVRNSQAIKTHIFCSLQAFVRLEKMRSTNSISNWYQLQRNLFTLVIRKSFLTKSRLWHLLEDEREEAKVRLAASWGLKQWGEEVPMWLAEIEEEEAEIKEEEKKEKISLHEKFFYITFNIL